MQPIDLRSDTITQPTPAMRNAMANAEVGDDVLGDDPTVQLLEQQVASLLGKEAALFTPSGTMANQIAIRAHTQPGDEILIDANAHVYFYESGAPAALAGVMCGLLPGQRGIFTPDDILNALRPNNHHFPPTKLVCLENTHNRGGGSIWPLQQIEEVAVASRNHNLKLHLDGARLWNASVASGIPEATYAQYFDSVSVCFSKGLGAPVGSALCGPADFIDRARRFRKMFGGAMRQSGILAAAALYALENHRDRLAEDHLHAQQLATGLAATPGVQVDPITVETNILMIHVPGIDAPKLADALNQAGVRMLPTGPNTLRAVTNLMVPPEAIPTAIAVFNQTLQQLTNTP
jgi:threonine aldolase